MKDLTEIMKDNLDPDEDLGAAMTNPKKWSACIKLGIKPIHHPIKNSKSNLSPEKRETLLNAAFIWTRTPPEYFHPKDVEILESTMKKNSLQDLQTTGHGLLDGMPKPLWASPYL